MPGSAFSSPSKTDKYSNILLTFFPSSRDGQGIKLHRQRLEPYFETITFAHEGVPSDAELANADVIYGLPRGEHLKSVNQVPKLKLIQLVNAGSDGVLNSPLWEDERAKDIKLATASGVHTGPIPQVCAT
jgi:hypothetical protein